MLFRLRNILWFKEETLVRRRRRVRKRIAIVNQEFQAEIESGVMSSFVPLFLIPNFRWILFIPKI